jgi:hypothetical protein
MAGGEVAGLLEGLTMRFVLTAVVSAMSLMFAVPALAQKDKSPAPAAQTPLPTLSMVVPQRDRDATYAYYRAEIAAGRCPPPLVKKDKACQAAAPAKPVWKLDQPLADGIKAEPPPAALINKLSPSAAGYQYMRVDNDILLVGIGTRVVTAFVADLSRLPAGP